MFSKKTEEPDSHWTSFSDLFSGFMVVFIIVSLIALGQMNPPPTPKPSGPAGETDAGTEASSSEGKYKEVVSIFQKHVEELDAVELIDSSTVRFSVKSGSLSPLFRPNKAKTTTYFRSVLDRFIPAYLKEVDSLFSRQEQGSFTIREIRIEGHTDPVGDYLYNLGLSSNRALEVQRYILGHEAMNKHSTEFRRFMEEHSIACGYSFSKTLDHAGKRVDHRNRRSVDFDKSRRVELRIIIEHKN